MMAMTLTRALTAVTVRLHPVHAPPFSGTEPVIGIRPRSAHNKFYSMKKVQEYRHCEEKLPVNQSLLHSIVVLCFLTASMTSNTCLAKETETNTPPVGKHIQRTMSLLAGATPEHRTPVKILLYGQSIVRQDYIRKLLASELARRYPNAELTIENRAIGGYTAPALQYTALHDLYPFYPDLVIFHVYGGEGGEFEGILRSIREKTTAEILTWPHHVDRGGPERTPKIEAGSELRRNLARKYDCELVELRQAWKTYLQENSLQASDLLVDVVHLNRRGGELMARLVADHFVEPENGPESWTPMVQSFDGRDGGSSEANPITFSGKPWRRERNAMIGDSPDSALKLRFHGNRVVVTAHRMAGPLGSARILVDGKAVSSYPECYAATLPTPTPIDYRPALKLVEIGDEPREEDWTLLAQIDSDDGREFRFNVIGSVSGEDGQGDHTKPLVSESGRLRIQPKMFSFAEAVRIRKKVLPERFDVRWKVYLNGVDVWKPKLRDDLGAIDQATLVQGITNEPHVLTIIPNGDGPVPVASLTVHRPPIGRTASGAE